MRKPRAISRFARYLWAAPCTAVGLCVVAPAFLFGARAQVVKGVVEVALSAHKRQGIQLQALSINAITFGHVVVATTESELNRLRAHEHEHVRQYERWGASFFVAYPLASFWQLLNGRRPYMDNWFEVRARAKESIEPRGENRYR